VDGTGLVKSGNESEMCRFCHINHISSPKKPLWRLKSAGRNYIPYKSSTTQAMVGQPSGSSLLCLSCHDGTIAPAYASNSETLIDFSSGIMNLPKGSKNLTTDLSDDHPISFIYSSSLVLVDRELVDPNFLPETIRLENEQLQCTSCHDPHNNTFNDFLVVTSQYSQLCLQCHQKKYWPVSSHNLSNATWKGFGSNPWFHTPYETVAENACENCHSPHNAEGRNRLLNYFSEETNCLICHNGSVAATDIRSMLNKSYVHNVYSYSRLHDPEERNIVQTRHVECADCHNPHASRNFKTAPPYANGFIEGVQGVDRNGNSVAHIQFQYELCYRCHADSPVKPASATPRQIEQNNVRLEFDSNNPSYHPIENLGKNPDVPSLISPLSESGVIYCTDCHSSNGNDSPKGPHGSIYPHILKYRYETADYTPESYQNYELCYQCHNRNLILNGLDSFTREVHRKHIVEEQTPCNVCHEPHGISSSQGNSMNHTHLINFDISVVSPDPVTGKLEFADLGNFNGSCYLRCHGKNHSPESY
jgi:predicted CXXCH cytochrome family protein